MEVKEFEFRLIESTKKLIAFTQSRVVNSISDYVEYLIEPNDRTVSSHLNEREIAKLYQINQLSGNRLRSNEVAEILTDSGLVPLWINMTVERAQKSRTIVKLSCSRRLRKEKDLYHQA